MFRAGQLHYTYEVPIDKIAIYREKQSQELQIYPYLGSYFYRFNTKVKHLRDKRVRRALAMAVDRQKITDQILKAGQVPAYAITPPNTMGYYPQSNLGFDPDKARALLAEAGYPDGQGFPKTEILYNTQEEHRKVAVAIQQMWKEVLNIDVVLLNQEWKVYLDNVANGHYEIARGSWIGDYVDPNNFLDMWLCDGGNNRTGWCNSDYDRMILEQTPQAKNHAERLKTFTQAEKLLLDNMPVLPLYIYVSKHLVSPSIKNFPPNILNQPSFKEIYLEDSSHTSSDYNSKEPD
jgi:oligopeptide transport system substrate-binding protein